MADPRSRHQGRRSPTFNPARASMPVNIGYNLAYTGEPHGAPASRYDPSAPRRHETKAASGSSTPTTTTYTVNKDSGVSRSLSRSNRHRSTTVDAVAGKPIIVTTNHPRPHVTTTSHAPSSARDKSPTRESYRPSEEYSYSVQPASSNRSRSQQRYSYTYHQGAPLNFNNDEFYRLRERVGGNSEDRFWVPARTNTDNFRNPRPVYATPAHPAHPAQPATPAHHATPVYANTSAALDYDDDYYEYTKPSDLARYDLDHDRRGGRDSTDRVYYRPHVNLVSSVEPGRYEARPRTKPPMSAGMDRYNQRAATGAYDRPSVTMPAPPAVPPPPPLDTTRRPALIEGPRSPPIEQRSARPRPVSLYQDEPSRPPRDDDVYRARDDDRSHRDRRERDDGYRDENVPTRGFGIRTDTLDFEERRPRPDLADRDTIHVSDESLNRVRSRERDSADDYRPRTEENRDRKDGLSRHGSVSRARDKITGGLKAAAASVGLTPLDGHGRDDNISPRRRVSDEDRDFSPRATESGKPRDREAIGRERSPRSETVAGGELREPRRERGESLSETQDRGYDDKRERGLDRDQGRRRDYDREYENDRESSKEQRDRGSADEAKSSHGTADAREAPSENASNHGRRRHRPSMAFDPTDIKGLMDLKAELDNQKPSSERGDKANGASSPPGTNSPAVEDESQEESRGRELVPAPEEKQVRVVSPPRDKSEQKPIKGILKQPKARFPEEANPIREGVAPHKDDPTKKDVPPGARWTKISRKKVNPEALSLGKERFEVRDDFVIVLRVLNKEEIQEYAVVTAKLREKRRKEHERELKGERLSDAEHTRSDEERQRRHRHRQESEDDEYRRGRGPEDRQRRRKNDGDSESRPKTIEYHPASSGHHHHQRYYENNGSASEERR
ncbi:hypothetical protein F5Y17DRAFT_450986 [Xylariaceae sp. FL0594]|nr:hypothetical protein F5Y17DRAFT_450986 [Xylariaceae sp. FL0594]